MLTEDQGTKAIIALQAFADIEESEEHARANWRSFSDNEKKSTESAHKAICGGFPDANTLDANQLAS